MSESRPRPPYRVLSPRLTLRCWSPSDAAELDALARRDCEPRAPWLSGAAPSDGGLAATVELLRRYRGAFDLGRDFRYAIVDRGSDLLLGATGLLTRCGPGGLEIGSWIDAASSGRGYATEATSALVRVAFERMRAERVEIRATSRNERAEAIPRKLGFTREGVFRRRVPWSDGELRDACSWTLLFEEHAERPSAELAIECFDVLGDPEPV